MTRRRTTPQTARPGRRAPAAMLALAASMATLLMTANQAAAQAPHSCPSKTGVAASCVDDPTGVLLSSGSDKGYVLAGGNPAAQRGELGVCAKNPSTPTAPGGAQGGPGYYYVILANPPSPPAHEAQCPGAAPPGDDYGQPQPQPQPEGEPESSPPPEPPANPRPREGDRAKLKRCLKQAKKINGRGKRRDAVQRCQRRFGD